jgi:hypothetical protein
VFLPAFDLLGTVPRAILQAGKQSTFYAEALKSAMQGIYTTGWY